MLLCSNLCLLGPLLFIPSESLHTPTKRSNAQHLVEYWKQFLREENKKSGNVMQQTMHYYVYGMNLRSESSLIHQIYISRKIGVTRIRQERVYCAKSKYDLMRILSEPVFIPQTQEPIGCCMTFSDY